jgi:peptidoglycan hydrolase CwlO-like protein
MKKLLIAFLLISSPAYAQSTPTVVDTVNDDGSVTRVTTITYSASQYQNIVSAQQYQLQQLQTAAASINAQIGALTPQVNNAQTVIQQSQSAIAAPSSAFSIR